MDVVVVLEAAMQTIVTGLMVGTIYGLMGCGVGVIFGVMRVVNFGQGEFMMLAMYGAVFAAGLLGATGHFSGTPAAYVGILLTAPAIFAFGLVVHRLLLSRVTGLRVVGVQGEGHYAQMILTLGISLILQNVALALFGAIARQNRTPISDEAWMVTPITGLDAMVFINKGQAVSCLIAAASAVGLALFLGRTQFGQALRAAADNPVAATYVGIKVERAHRFAFAFGIMITGVAGGLISVYFPFQPYIGVQFLIIMYAAVVLGGLGSILGAFWGGVIIGLVQQVSTLFLPLELQSAAIFVVFVTTLFFLPQGLFGRSAERI